jgi:hypothetical protein
VALPGIPSGRMTAPRIEAAQAKKIRIVCISDTHELHVSEGGPRMKSSPMEMYMSSGSL